MGKRKQNYRNNHEFIDTAYINSQTYFDYLNRFKQLAITQFEWVNLPDTMNAIYLEMCLYYFGKASLLKDEDFGFINTKCVANGKLNIYGLPTSFNCYSYGYDKKRKLYTGIKEDEYDSCILVRNNAEMIPTAPTLELFAKRLYEAERTCDVNVKAQKTPMIIKGDENSLLTLKNLYEKYDGNEPVIIYDKKQLGKDLIESIKTDAPVIFDKLMIYKMQIWNEALTFLGINNVAVEKKERLVESEATGNNELINLNLEARLQVRKLACKEFNDYFGLTGTDKEIDVKVRSDLFNVVKTMDSIYDLPPEEKQTAKDEVI